MRRELSLSFFRSALRLSASSPHILVAVLIPSMMCFILAGGVLAEQRRVGLQIVPGTGYKVYALYEDKAFVNCKATIETRDAELTFAVMQKGTFVMVLSDQYQHRAVKESLGWKEGSTYSGQIYVGDKTWNIQFESLDPNIFIFKPNKQFLDSLSNQKELAVQIGGISMRGGYDIRGFSTIRSFLKNCYEQHTQNR